MGRQPADIGMHISEVDTPALILDLDRFEANLAHLQDLTRASGVRLRPHAKTHKSSRIARLQMEAGAVGVCCQKVSEAEAMVDGGVTDVFVSNEVVGPRKLRRLAALAGRCRLAVAVDALDNVVELAAAVAEAGTQLDVLVERDVGSARCGVRDSAAALALAQAIAAHDQLHFRGLHAYYGGAQHIHDYRERRAAIMGAAEQVRETVEVLEHAGLPVEIVTGAGTGSFPFEIETGLYNEIQAGSYLFMDRSYAAIEDREGRKTSEFAQSLFILATVMSRPEPDLAVVDAGLKAFSTDSGLPLVSDDEAMVLKRISDEHATISLPSGSSLALGQKIRLTPGHCDPTINMHEWYVCIRNDVVVDLWAIDARGAFF
jgi:D-serine deaminase-like pyridoxal phosphate-dependent protein